MLPFLGKTNHKRTLFLAVLATVCFVVAAIRMFEVEPAELLEFFLAAVVCLLIIIVAAFLMSLLVRTLRRYF